MNNHAAILAQFNIKSLNDMQHAMLDAVQKPNDVVLVAPTGSGKTLGFLLPMLRRLKKDVEGVQLLIVVPSRELAIQIEQVFKQMKTGYKIGCFYGGHAVRIEENSLTEAPTVVVGTPGRLGHHLRKHSLSLRKTSTIILDEFDKSLEFGFQKEMEYLLAECKSLEKRILTSATAIDEMPEFVGLTNEVVLDFTEQYAAETKAVLNSKFVRVEGDDKLEALMLLLGISKAKSTIVFCNHREAVERIAEQLEIHKVAHGYYHGGLEQIDREKTLIKLRNGSVNLLITTDLASRGLDIPEIEAVIHYQLPPTREVLTHRNGRTARMHGEGTAWYLLDKEDHLPRFLDAEPVEVKLPSTLTFPAAVEWKTLYIGAGKKDKVNKVDIVGMLLQKGKLQKDELGKIEVLDHSSYAAVKSSKINAVLQLVKDEKLKGKKYKIAISS